MSLDFGRAVTYPFEDERWRGKLLPLLILSVVPGMNALAWGGYTLSMARAIYRRGTLALVTWDEWSDILVRGLLSWVAATLYYLPALIIGGCFWLLPLVIGGRAESSSFLAMRCLAYLFVGAYAFAASALLNAGHVAFARTDQFASYLDLKARLGDWRHGGSRLLTLTLASWALLLVGVVTAAIAYGVFLIGVNVIVRFGAGFGVLVVPALLVVLVGLLGLFTLTALANGYFVGATGVLLTRLGGSEAAESSSPRDLG